MSIASFSGLASGIQWRDMLDQINRAETIKRLQPLQRGAGLEQQRISTLGRYRELVTRLETAAKALQEGTAFGRFNVTAPASPTTGRTLLTATVSDSAAPGSHDVEVVALARTHTMASSVHGSDTEALGLAGSFSLGGTAIEVGEDDGLAAIRDRINAAGAGVTASVLRVADGSYRLTLTSNTTGAAGIAFQDGDNNVGAALGLTLAPRGEGDPPSAGFSVAGADARVRINGVEITRTGNTVADAITGITLNLQQAEQGTQIRVAVARDEAAITDSVRNFVTAYNAIRTFVDGQTSSPTEPLNRSSVLRQSLASFREVLLGAPGAPDGVEGLRLGVAGVALNRQGMLELDTGKLSSALAENREGLRNLLADVGTRMQAATTAVTTATTGTIAAQVRLHENAAAALNRRADDVQLRLDRQYERMEREFITMEKALGRINAQGNWLTQQINAMQPVRR